MKYFSLYLKDKLIVLYFRSIVVNHLIRSFLHIKNKKNRESLIPYSPFEYQENSKRFGLYHDYYFVDNEYYGILWNLCNYSNFKKKPKVYIEHGLYIGNIIQPGERKAFVNTIITLGDHREKIIKSKINKEVVKIGPYIHYAKSYYTDKELELIKQKLGKTLLFFPSHSTKAEMISHDIARIDSFLDDFKKQYNTIMICFYWKDIENGLATLYENKGYTIVSAGYYYDRNFLPRLKSIILLSDYSISSNVGTHIGYCLYLNIPHYILPVPNKIVLSDESHARKQKQYGDDYESIEQDLISIREMFSFFTNVITEEQYNFANTYWGFEYIKLPEEMFQILDSGKQQ